MRNKARVVIIVECDYDPKQVNVEDLAGDIATDIAVHFSLTSSLDDAYNLSEPEVSVEWHNEGEVRILDEVAAEEGQG